MKNTHIAFLSFLLILITIFTGCGINNNSTHVDTVDNYATDDNKILAEVNGEQIFKYEIDEVYKLYNNTVSYKKILEDSIFELIVLQQSNLYGLSIADEEVNSILEQYKKTQPDYYSQAIDLYGEDRLREKIKNTNLYSKTKDYIFTNLISNQNTITDNEYNEFLSAYNLNEYMSQFENKLAIQNHWSEIQDFLFRTWVNELKDQSSITVFNNINNDDDVNINKIDNFSSLRIDSKSKEAFLENWNFDFISKIEIPFKLNITNYYEVFMQPLNIKKEDRDKTEYSQLAYYSIVLQGDSEKNIFVNFSEESMPIRDYGIVGLKYSFVKNTEVMIAEYESLYIAQFTNDNINFDIEFQNIDEQDMLVILQSIL